MALSARSILEWAGSIRSIFNKMEDEPADLTRSPDIDLDDDVQMGSEGQDQPSESDLETEAGINTEDEEGQDMELSLSEKMEVAKKRYPGAKDWAKHEEKLFEILYLRQDLPMLPSYWHVDFRGFPLPERIFETSDEQPPIIYARSKNGTSEYAATSAVTRIIDLTLAVRTLLESDQPGARVDPQRKRLRAANLIKDRLDSLLAWAARDGGYDGLKTVPNIVAEVVDTVEVQDDIVEWMTGRMKALVRLQQEFLRVDRGDDFWTSTEPEIMRSARARRSTPGEKIRSGRKRGTETRPTQTRLMTPELYRDELSTESPDTTLTPQGVEYGPSKRRLFKKRNRDMGDADELAESNELAKRSRLSDFDAIKHDDNEPVVKVENLDESTPNTFKTTERVKVKVEEGLHTDYPTLALPQTPLQGDLIYRRKPPVVYGLYILGTSIILLTADASKGRSAYISFHVDINFADNHQGVWNALTIAAVVCAARDDLMTRLEDFEPLAKLPLSDPDA